MNVVAEASRWIRVQQAADLLGVSASTVRRWVAEGRLACQRTPSGQRRFLVEDLERASHQANAPTHDHSPSYRNTEERYQLLFETSLELASSQELTEVLQSAAQRLSVALSIPDCDIYRLEDARHIVCLASSARGVYDADWVGRKFCLDDWPCDRLAVETRTTITVRDLADPRLSEVERCDLRAYGQCSFMALPLVAHDRVIGVVDLLDHAEREFTEQEIVTAEAVGQLVALALERAQLCEELKRLHLSHLRALSSALGAKDYYSLGHAGRVAAYMALLGSELGWSEDYIEKVQNVAFLHDIGKIGISDRVLLKPGPLTSEEWELVRQHPAIGAEIVRPLFDEELIASIRHHHERFDGDGYPDRLAGEAIPLAARALCVVDCYDAMSCQRPYRRALSYPQCLAELRRCAGAQFDPAIVEAFRRALQHLQQRRARAMRVASQAAQLIDPVAHARLRTRADEARPEYEKTVSALRVLRRRHPYVRYITSFAVHNGQCVTVLDTGETESDVSHIGDPWLPDDELASVLADEHVLCNVINNDNFGVWISGTAPIRDAEGTVVAAVTVDIPAVDSRGRPLLYNDRSRTLTATLEAAAIRFSRAEVEAITDGLTGLYNHRYLHERLGEELERAQRRGSKLSLLFCDCDRFKVYNDNFGHKAGDTALARMARIIAATSRRSDLAARYGGEEFVLVLVDTDTAGALTVAEHLRSQIELSSARSKYPLTISIGIATFPDDADTRDELLDKADWAMYAAKRAGRNCVHAFSDGIDPRSAARPRIVPPPSRRDRRARAGQALA